MAASSFNTTDINSSQRINSRRRLSTGTLRLPPTSREALVAKRGPLLPYDYVLRVLSAANNPLDVTHTQHVDPTPSVTTNTSLLHPAVKLYFDKTELQQMGVLELPVANCYLLKNKIHPIFGRQNFENAWHHVWPHIQQILRLASRFIDDEAVLPFWHALLFERRPMLGLPPIESYVPERFSVGGPLNLQQMERTRICLQHYGGLGALKIGFYTDPMLECHAYCSRDMGRSLTKHTYPGTNSFIKLDDRYRDVLDRHITGRKPMTESQLLRFQFAIAKTLVHEVAHAVYRTLSLSPIEPYVNIQLVSELGRAWELWTFGCLPTPALSLRDCSHGLVCIAPWPDNFETTRTLNPAGPVRPILGPMNVGRVSYAVEMEWIQKVQTEEFWDIEVKHRGVDALKIPLKEGIKRFDPATDECERVRGRDFGKEAPSWSQWQAEWDGMGGRLDSNIPPSSLSSGCREFDL